MSVKAKKPTTKIDFADPSVTIVKRRHSPTCEGPDMTSSHVVWRDKIGRRNSNGNTRFEQYRCMGQRGEGQCSAEVLVNLDSDIARALNEVSK